MIFVALILLVHETHVLIRKTHTNPNREAAIPCVIYRGILSCVPPERSCFCMSYEIEITLYSADHITRAE